MAGSHHLFGPIVFQRVQSPRWWRQHCSRQAWWLDQLTESSRLEPRVRSRKNKLSKPTLNEVPLLTGPYLLNYPQQSHQQGTRRSNALDYGKHFSFKPPPKLRRKHTKVTSSLPTSLLHHVQFLWLPISDTSAVTSGTKFSALCPAVFKSPLPEA